MKLEVFILSLQFFTSLFFVGINSANAVVPSDTFFDEQWYLKKIKAIEAWDITRDSPNIVIAIIDSGVEIDNPDLKDNVWRNVKEAPDNGIDDDKNGYVDDVNGWDFVNNSNNPRPKFNKGFTEAGVLHGTIVAGIAAASGNNASGIAGVTWRAQIMPLKVLDDTGEGRTDKVIEAINYAIKNGADIINLSFVGFNDSKNLELTIKRAYDAGIIIVAAAGNEQNQGDGYFLDKTPMYPVCNDGPNGENWVLGVVATDALDEKASFSSYGFKCTDIAAPGVSIFSTSINNPAKSFEGNPFDKNFEGYWAGTSMAVPMISGTIALIEATNPSLSRQGIYQALLDRSDNISLLNQQYLGRLGKGRLNVLESVKYASQVLRDKKEKIIITGEKSEGASVREFYLNGEFDQEFPVFDKSIKGASIATCDLDHDGISEIIAGAKAGGAPLIKIFNHNGEIRKQFLAFANNFKLGVNVACGDLNNDGFSEIVVSANGGGQQVRIFDKDGILRGNFFPYDKNFKGGVNVAVGDVDGNGSDEIITGTGENSGPHIKVFDAQGKIKNQFFAFNKNRRYGSKVTVANFPNKLSSRKARIIVTEGKGGDSIIKIFDNTGRLINSFNAYANNSKEGIDLASGDVSGDGFDEIIVGAGLGSEPLVRYFDYDGKLLGSFLAYNKNLKNGVNVASITINNN